MKFLSLCGPLKGKVSRDFLLLVFFMNSFSQAPEYTSRAFQIFRKLAEIFAAQLAYGKNLQS